MNSLIRRKTGTSKAAVETIVAIIVIVGLIGIGAYALHRRTATTGSLSSNIPAGGTSESIDQLTANDAASEQQADKSTDSQLQQDAVSANGAVNNVGGAYDESTL